MSYQEPLLQDVVFRNLVQKLRFPDNKNWRAEFDKARLKLIEDALCVRPYFLPVQHDLPGAASLTPIPVVTEQVKFPLIITGAISDGDARDVRLYINNKRRPLIGFGDFPDLRLSLDAVAGHPVAIAGYAGPLDWVSALPLDELDYLTLEMYQDLAAEARVTTCFNAYRVFTPNNSEATLTERSREHVLEQIAIRPAPLTTYDIVPVEFSLPGAGGVAITKTPDDEDPYLIHAFRSSFTDAMISIGYDDQRGFSKTAFPIWAIASEATNSRQVWNYLKQPIFMDAHETLNMRLDNTIDGVNFAENGTIEILKTTC